MAIDMRRRGSNKIGAKRFRQLLMDSQTKSCNPSNSGYNGVIPNELPLENPMLIQRITGPISKPEPKASPFMPKPKPKHALAIALEAFNNPKSDTPVTDAVEALYKAHSITAPSFPDKEPLGFIMLPLSDNHHSEHLNWIAVEPLDFPECDVSAKSKALQAVWYISYDKHARYRLLLNGMVVGDSTYQWISTAQVVAERCEDAIRINPVSFADVMQLLGRVPE